MWLNNLSLFALIRRIKTNIKKSSLVNNSKIYYIFSILMVVTNIPKIFFIPQSGILAYDLLNYLLLIIATLCIFLCFHDFWLSNREFAVIFWYFTLLFSLPFTASYTMFLTKQVFWIINYALSLVLLLIFIINFINFVLVSFFGTLAGYIMYYSIFYSHQDEYENIISLSPNYAVLAFYSCFVITLIISVIIYIKKKEEKAKIKSLQIFGRAIAHEVMNPFLAIQSQLQLLDSLLKDGNYDKAKQMSNELSYMIEQGIKDTKLILGNIKDVGNAHDIKQYSIKHVVDEALKEYYMNEEQKVRIDYKIEEDFYFIGSKHLVKHVIFNLIKNVFKHAGKDAIITIWTEKNNKLHFKDSGFGIREKVLSNIFKRFYTGSSTGTGIGLSFCAEAMDWMEGSIECFSEYEKYTEFVITFKGVANIQKN